MDGHFGRVEGEVLVMLCFSYRAQTSKGCLQATSGAQGTSRREDWKGKKMISIPYLV